MSQDLLFDANIWLILIASIVLFLGATYIGFCWGAGLISQASTNIQDPRYPRFKQLFLGCWRCFLGLLLQ